MRHLAALILVIPLLACAPSDPVDQDAAATISVEQRMGSTPDPGFVRALEPRTFLFPADHGAHPEFATEWWYFTGNLRTADDERFGYQLTLFRVGLIPGEPLEDSRWRSHQLYMGHLAISDIAQGRHHSSERFSRAAAGLAGATRKPLRIWLGPWSIEGSGTALFPLRLRAETPEMAIDLQVHPGDRPMVLQGDRGLSQKGAAPGNASYYYSYTRLPTRGDIRLDDRRLTVVGNSWFDREWSSSALAEDQAGWDWFALQLDDERDLMFYRMRDKQGQAQRFSKGVLVAADGTVLPLSLDDVTLTTLGEWRSDDGVAYPTRWRLQIPGHAIDLRVEAAFDDQEMRHTVRYWEGAVVVSGSHDGVGYLELSGYAR